MRDLAENVATRLKDVQQQQTWRVRHNPADCNCPELEVFVESRWYRLALDTYDGPVATALVAAIAESANEAVPPLFLVSGRLDTTPRACGRAAIHLMLAAESFNGRE